MQELTKYMDNEGFKNFFDVRNIDIKHAELVFQMLSSASDNKQEVGLETFVLGLLRLRGPAESIDLHTLSFEVKLLSAATEQAFHDIKMMLGKAMVNSGSNSFTHTSDQQQKICEGSAGSVLETVKSDIGELMLLAQPHGLRES